MNSSLYIGATGMKGLAEGMNVTTNNIANVSTIGFKQQDVLFSDILYQTQGSMGNWWNAQEDSRVAIGQVGMGLQVEAVRTKHTQGELQQTTTMTDLAINGKGFFQVSDGDQVFYTRAGDFRSDAEGVWRTPTGLALNGFPLDASGARGELSAVKVDALTTMAPRATTNVELTLNLNLDEPRTINETSPFFSLMQAYDATQDRPLSSSAYGASQTMTVYDAEGQARRVTAYFDAAASSAGRRYTEFVIADDQASSAADSEMSGLLMSGVLEFDTEGNLLNVAAFTPSVEGSRDLADWTPATLADGKPAISLGGSEIGLDFGLSASGDWQNAPKNAAEIGANGLLLPTLGEDAIRSQFPTTAYNISSTNNSYKQDGYAEGALSTVSISSDGIVTGTFSNGQIQDLWEIPVCRFTSEDGLRREGGNLFAATEEAGIMEMGRAGTENYGEVLAYNIENSNVDMANEMVSMIITQRGFQSNSKVVTTADEMLKKAMELKR